jgi:3-isopropylmalate dehydratase small subunit
MMKKVFKGRVWKFGDCIDSGNIKGVMAGIDPEFHKKVQPGDLIVAGINFGMGSSGEDAPRSLRDAGVAAILAESISNIICAH